MLNEKRSDAGDMRGRHGGGEIPFVCVVGHTVGGVYVIVPSRSGEIAVCSSRGHKFRFQPSVVAGAPVAARIQFGMIIMSVGVDGIGVAVIIVCRTHNQNVLGGLGNIDGAEIDEIRMTRIGPSNTVIPAVARGEDNERDPVIVHIIETACRNLIEPSGSGAVIREPVILRELRIDAGRSPAVCGNSPGVMGDIDIS